MASCTVLTIGPAMNVLGSVAGITICWKFSTGHIFFGMAVITPGFGMSSRQLELGVLLMIERNAGPTICGMATLAPRCKSPCMGIIFAMTCNAIAGRSFVNRRFVA